mmetsp:Transcript_22125/g.31303  ORF Transcript_22125/g.31303 Transcript_22125/m.31303 type:complete len:186 (+) Transcript_22125:39-596(+)
MADSLKQNLVDPNAGYAPPPMYQPQQPGDYQQQGYQQQGYQQQGYQQPPQGYQQPQGYQPYPQAPMGQPVVQQQAAPNIIISNNQQVGGVASGEFVPDYCFLSWFACLCCCWPIGICAIIQSQAVQQRLAAGDVAGARSASGAARSLGIAAMGFGLVAIIIVIILFATGAFIASTYYPYYDPYYG